MLENLVKVLRVLKNQFASDPVVQFAYHGYQFSCRKSKPLVTLLEKREELREDRSQFQISMRNTESPLESRLKCLQAHELTYPRVGLDLSFVEALELGPYFFTTMLKYFG